MKRFKGLTKKSERWWIEGERVEERKERKKGEKREEIGQKGRGKKEKTIRGEKVEPWNFKLERTRVEARRGIKGKMRERREERRKGDRGEN